jgi:hypothetical protein
LTAVPIVKTSGFAHGIAHKTIFDLALDLLETSVIPQGRVKKIRLCKLGCQGNGVLYPVQIHDLDAVPGDDNHSISLSTNIGGYAVRH